MAIAIESLTCDRPIKSLEQVFGEMEFSLESLRELRRQVIDEGGPSGDRVTVTLGLYIQYIDRLLAKGRELSRNRQED